MKTLMSSILMVSMLGFVSAGLAEETQAEKYQRCQAERQKCIDSHQGDVTTNSFGVRMMPTWVVEQCGNTYKDCMGIPRN
jgi:hypothetical protein